MVICPKCGTKLPQDLRNCPRCGALVHCTANSFDIGRRQPVNPVNTKPAISVSSSDQPAAPLADSFPGTGLKPKTRKALLIGAVLILMVAMGVMVAYRLTRDNSDKLIGAFENTLRAESFRCDISAFCHGEQTALTVEAVGKDIDASICLETDSQGRKNSFIYSRGKFYTGQNRRWESFEDKDLQKVFDALCRRSWVEAAKADGEIKKAIKQAVKNYDEAIPILENMVREFYRSGKAEYVTAQEKKGSTYGFTIDVYKMAKTAKRDHGLRITSRAMEVLEAMKLQAQLSITLDGDLVDSVECILTSRGEPNDPPRELLRFSARFSDIDNITHENSLAGQRLNNKE